MSIQDLRIFSDLDFNMYTDIRLGNTQEYPARSQRVQHKRINIPSVNELEVKMR